MERQSTPSQMDDVRHAAADLRLISVPVLLLAPLEHGHHLGHGDRGGILLAVLLGSVNNLGFHLLGKKFGGFRILHELLHFGRRPQRIALDFLVDVGLEHVHEPGLIAPDLRLGLVLIRLLVRFLGGHLEFLILQV